jgi:hypothetical protein
MFATAMNKISGRVATLLLLITAALNARAQTEIGLPDVSQAASVEQRVGVVDVTINYHRPLVNGRKVWGALVPYDKVWRAGANTNTTFEVNWPVAIEGKPLPKATYGLHMIPGADTWTIIFSKAAHSWGSYTYDQSEDALRVTVKPHPAPMKEALQYTFDEVKPDSAVVTMAWEKVAVPFRITVSDEETVLPYLRQQLRGIQQYTWGPPNEAAQYCLTKKIALPEALKWAELSIQNEERFENLATKADILKAMGKTAEADKTWQHAVEIAKPAQLYAYARQLQGEKREAEAMTMFQKVVERSPNDLFGHVASARLKSHAGDFSGASEEIKKAMPFSPNEAQTQALQAYLDKLSHKQDINK